MVAIPGSEYLGSALHVIAQSLLIPVIAGLLAFGLCYNQSGGDDL